MSRPAHRRTAGRSPRVCRRRSTPTCLAGLGDEARPGLRPGGPGGGSAARARRSRRRLRERLPAARSRRRRAPTRRAPRSAATVGPGWRCRRAARRRRAMTPSRSPPSSPEPTEAGRSRSAEEALERRLDAERALEGGVAAEGLGAVATRAACRADEDVLRRVLELDELDELDVVADRLEQLRPGRVGDVGGEALAQQTRE